MGNHKPITPEGTKDYLFDEANARRQITEKLKDLYESRGYRAAITPFIEFLDVFSGKGRGMPIEYMYKMTDHEGRLLVLRPDSTTPIARLCATRLKDQAPPIRIYYTQPVYFSQRLLSGRQNEVLQSGIELIAPFDERADLEALSLAISALERISPSFRLEIGHIGIFNSLIDGLALDEQVKEEIRACVEMKNYPALNDMLDKIGETPAVAGLKLLPRLFGGREVFEKARTLIMDEKTAESINYLEMIYEKLMKIDTKGEISVDLGIVNRTDYYTGIVFRGFVEGYGDDTLSGGRYDNLISGFGRDIGAVGFAVNIDATANISEAAEKADKTLVFAEKGYEPQAITLLNRLSEQEICEWSLHQSLDEASEYAKANGFSRLVAVGETKKEIIL